MPNFLAVLKEEITRLSRKELRKQVDPIKKSSAAHRRQIAAMKRQIVKLERTVSLLGRRAGKAEKAAPAESAERPQRFVAKGLRSLRARLGLSAADFAALVGVSGQSIYNWETGKAAPRREQLTALASLRGLGKREALARLEQTKGGKARKPRDEQPAPTKRGRAAAKGGARKTGTKRAAAKRAPAKKGVAKKAARKPRATKAAVRKVAKKTGSNGRRGSARAAGREAASAV